MAADGPMWKSRPNIRSAKFQPSKVSLSCAELPESEADRSSSSHSWPMPAPTQGSTLPRGATWTMTSTPPRMSWPEHDTPTLPVEKHDESSRAYWKKPPTKT